MSSEFRLSNSSTSNIDYAVTLFDRFVRMRSQSWQIDRLQVTILHTGEYILLALASIDAETMRLHAMHLIDRFEGHGWIDSMAGVGQIRCDCG